MGLMKDRQQRDTMPDMMPLAVMEPDELTGEEEQPIAVRPNAMSIRERRRREKADRKDAQLNAEILEKEKAFIPSFDFMIPRAQTPRAQVKVGAIESGLRQQPHFISPKARKKAGIERGKASEAFPVFNSLFGEEGELGGLLHAPHGISDQVTMQMVAAHSTEGFLKVSVNKSVRAFFSARKWKNGKREDKKLFNDRMKRKAVLSFLQKKRFKNLNVSEEQMKYIYEYAKTERKLPGVNPALYEAYRQDNPSEYTTRLDYNPNTDLSDIRPEDITAIKREIMAHTGEGGPGHAFVRFTSTDLRNQERMKFTVGFGPAVDTEGGGYFTKFPGTLFNPDVSEREANLRQQTHIISKEKYIKAMAFAQSYSESVYTVGKYNCARFAYRLAESAGVKPDMKSIMTVRSPDTLVDDAVLQMRRESNQGRRPPAAPVEAEQNTPVEVPVMAPQLPPEEVVDEVTPHHEEVVEAELMPYTDEEDFSEKALFDYLIDAKNETKVEELIHATGYEAMNKYYQAALFSAAYYRFRENATYQRDMEGRGIGVELFIRMVINKKALNDAFKLCFLQAYTQYRRNAFQPVARVEWFNELRREFDFDEDIDPEGE